MCLAHGTMLPIWHNTSGDWAQIRLKIVGSVDCVPLYWKFKMMLNGMWGAPCSQQGSALVCLIPGAPKLQMLHLEMSSHELILFVNICGCQVCMTCITVLWWFAASCAWHFTCPGSNYKQSTDHAILYVSLLTYKQGPGTQPFEVVDFLYTASQGVDGVFSMTFG